MREVIEQNRLLQEELRRQQKEIAELRKEVATVTANRQLEVPVEVPSTSFGRAALRLSGEVGIAYFDGGAQGQFPQGEFRIDEAKLFLETPLLPNIYAFLGLDLVIRESNDEFFHLGEAYVDFERLLQRWKQDRLLNVRAGRFYIPFGREYERRGVMDNPLITHSLSDIWGIDEGVMLYGSGGALDFAVAVQSGGHKTLRDYTSDKSVALRLGYTPSRNVSVTASAMRTGDLDAAGDALSELWFAGGFFRAIGASARLFRADLAQWDGAWNTKRTRIAGHVGRVWFDDDDPNQATGVRMIYYGIEAVQFAGEKLHGAARFSRIQADGAGYPLVGTGDFGRFFFRSPLTSHLTRFTFGLGYRFGPPLWWKLEYTIEDGRFVAGAPRDAENLVASEISLKF